MSLAKRSILPACCAALLGRWAACQRPADTSGASQAAPPAAPARDAAFTPTGLAQRTIERRAVEAVIWGMPIVNYDLMRQEMLKAGGQENQAVYWGRPLDSMNQTLTPNPDALYFMAFYNTKHGSIVLDLPSGDANGSFNGNIVTAWQMPLEDAGLLGADKG